MGRRSVEKVDRLEKTQDITQERQQIEKKWTNRSIQVEKQGLIAVYGSNSSV